MANTNNPFGAISINNLITSDYNGKANLYNIPSTDSNDYFVGDFVKSVANASKDGTTIITLAAAGEAIRGVVVRFYDKTANGNFNYKRGSKEADASIIDDPYAVFEIQCNGNLQKTDIGKYANIVYASGNEITGNSGTMLDIASLSTTSRQLKILSIVKDVNNEFGDYAKALVMIHDHELQHGVSGSEENIWKRSGTIIEPFNSGDDVDLGSGSITANNVNANNVNSIGDITIGDGTADTKLNINFNGLSNDGVIEYNPSTDNFNMACTLSLNGTQAIDEISDNSGISPTSSQVWTARACKEYTDDTLIPFFKFIGSISVPSDFPTLAFVKLGYVYQITSDVTDNDPTKTNTGKSFRAEDEIYWTGTTWKAIGSEVFDEYAELIDVSAPYANVGALTRVNNSSDGMIESTTLLSEPAANQWSLTRGTSAFAVQTSATINQDISTTSNVTFNDLTLTGKTILSVATPITLLAAETITPTESIIPISGNGGAVISTANPQIAVGTDGEVKILIGTNDTNTFTVVNGNGLSLDNGVSFTLGLNDYIEFKSYNSIWIEARRCAKG